MMIQNNGANAFICSGLTAFAEDIDHIREYVDPLRVWVTAERESVFY